MKLKTTPAKSHKVEEVEDPPVSTSQGYSGKAGCARNFAPLRSRFAGAGL